jgi:hypothetical protein
MNPNENEFITASTVFLAEAETDEQPMAENNKEQIEDALCPEMYYG